MKTMNKLGLCLWSGLALLAGQGASATTPAGPVPHFTLRVPLEVSKLHERVSHVFIRCRITAPRGLYAPQGPHEAVGQYLVSVDGQTGLPRLAAADVAINAPAGVDPRGFRTYRCTMQVQTDGSGPLDPSTYAGHPHSIDSSRPYQSTASGELKP